jgi:hypothetical protein
MRGASASRTAQHTLRAPLLSVEICPLPMKFGVQISTVNGWRRATGQLS